MPTRPRYAVPEKSAVDDLLAVLFYVTRGISRIDYQFRILHDFIKIVT